jgi:hypothetical protein
MNDNKAASDNGTHINFRPSDISIASQRAQILSYLKLHGSATTLDIRNKLHILSPAPRIFELRKQGLLIVTEKQAQPTPDGRSHSVAKYVLQSEVTLCNTA